MLPLLVLLLSALSRTEQLQSELDSEDLEDLDLDLNLDLDLVRVSRMILAPAGAQVHDRVCASRRRAESRGR